MCRTPAGRRTLGPIHVAPSPLGAHEGTAATALTSSSSPGTASPATRAATTAAGAGFASGDLRAWDSALGTHLHLVESASSSLTAAAGTSIAVWSLSSI